ncbi:MAG: ATP-binding protein [Anaerolineales bacterium]|nr:ATP-binding protein [Anaerolineales bacterium]
MKPNPFQYLDPVRPEAFVGRWPLVKGLDLNLRLEGGNSHAFIAGRRCGKSSVLATVGHLLRQASADAADWEAWPIPFDIKSGEFAAAGEVFARLLYETVRRIDVNARRRPADAWPHPIRLEAPWFADLAGASALNLQGFEDCLDYILRQLEADGHQVRLVFLIDEIDDTLDKPWTEGLFNNLRSLVNASELKSQIRLVFAGSHRFLDQVSRRGSPLWNVLKLHYLEPFDESGFTELMRRAPEHKPELAAAVWQESGGHPFVAQYFLHHLYSDDQGLAGKTLAQVTALAGKFISEQIHDLEGWAQGVDLGGFHAYSVLAGANDWIEERDILRAINNPELNIKRGLLALCYHGLAVHDDGWAHYRRAGDLFRTWFLDHGPAFLASRKVAEPVIGQMVQISGETVIVGSHAQVQQDQLSVGNITDANGIAIGRESSAEVKGKNAPEAPSGP